MAAHLLFNVYSSYWSLPQSHVSISISIFPNLIVHATLYYNWMNWCMFLEEGKGGTQCKDGKPTILLQYHEELMIHRNCRQKLSVWQDHQVVEEPCMSIFIWYMSLFSHQPIHNLSTLSKNFQILIRRLAQSLRDILQNRNVWTPYFARCVPTWWQNSLFIYLWKIDLLFKKWLRVATYFCFIFKKNGKQNKKENPKYDFLFEKGGLWKSKLGLRGQVTYWKSMVKTVAPL